MENKPRSGCFMIGLIIVLAGSLGLNLLLFIGMAASGASELGADHVSLGEKVVIGGSKDKIVNIPLRGVISGFEPGRVGETMVDDLKIQLKAASRDKDAKAVIVSIDSPGGEVTASDGIYEAIKKVRDEAKKPVIISMGSTAASGGYYAACGGSWIVAHDTTFTGSIGVIMQSLNYQQLFGKVGLEFHTFKSGKFKDMLSGSRTITEEEKEYVQGMIMQTYDKFVGIVAAERKLPEADLRTGLADGRVISGKDAHAAKLVDELGDFDTAVARARTLSGFQDARVVTYELPVSFARFLQAMGKSDTKAVQIQVAPTSSVKLEAGRMYFLPSFLAQ